ncbi:chemotaxis protein methyltransferase CheR [Desulfonauticus submarinus]|uniref:protein-glutamate O-methyltransferase n=1 Tax=Desulfonauticus submarinus TaxID=206665 RepID=A0A1H0EDL1_9BACT|nr:protein-glutamate O-methyltransferase CheR [Desulfonauticus submarinus]SDN80524.1 chemotaxis protein methyltransferase CheR [Desulfonauticus submarinus]
MKIKPEEFKVLTQYIYKISGIFLDPSKAYLLETRLKSLLEQEKASSYLELYKKALADPTKRIEKAIIDAITTKETLFFRDQAPFDLLKFKILPDLIDRRSKTTSKHLPIKIRIWSAACSTGQEVYSIAIAIKETIPDLEKYNITILGTDISDEAIAKASYGKYNKFEIERGLPPDKLRKYFDPTPDGQWRIKDEIRFMANFRKINLMKPFSILGKFDIIFCRNVAIYFAPEDKKKLFERIAQVLQPDGYLIIGSTESLAGITDLFVPKRYLRAIFYQLKSFKG